MSADVLPLWKSRKQAFWKEVLPYIRYMGQSGFPAFLSLIGIVSVIQYIKLIQNIPEQLPIEWIGAIVLTPFICYSPLRTWLKEADSIFLMPMEHHLTPYMQKSHTRSLRNGFLYLIIVTLLFWPLYSFTDAYAPIIFIMILIIFKVFNHVLAWRERQFIWSTTRNTMRIFRWLLMFMLMVGWLLSSRWGMFWLTIIIVVMLGILYRINPKQSFPWQRLIAEERNTMRRLYSFFSWFIDVNTGPPTVRQRRYLSWIIPLVPYRKQFTFFYLHLITFIRTEIGGICIRLLLLGGLVNYLAATSDGMNGWAVVVSYIIFGLMITLQIGTLRKVHRYAIWKDVFPLQVKSQQQQLILIEKQVSYVMLILLLIPTIPIWNEHLIQLTIMVVFTLLYPILRASNVKRKLKKEIDELD